MTVSVLAQRYLNHRYSLDHMDGVLEKLVNVNVQNPNSTTNVFQEIHDFLILTDLVILQIYLRNSQPRFKKQTYF